MPPDCICGHTADEHSFENNHYTACNAEVDGEPCACFLYEED